MNIKQILLLLKLRWWLVLALFAVIVGVTTAYSLVMPRQYTASSSLLLDVVAPNASLDIVSNLMMPGHMATQSNVIASDRVASRVVDMLGLAKNPSAVEQWRETTQGRIGLETYYGDLLLRHLTVETVPQSSMLLVSFTGKDPKFAAAVTNAFVKAYLDLSVEIALEPVRRAQETLEERLSVLRGDLRKAQDQLTAFTQKKGIVISNERLDLEQQRLNALEGSLATALAEEANQVATRAQSGGDASVEISSSPVVQGMRQQLSAAEAKLKEVDAIYGSRHPQRLQLEAQVGELRAQLNRETGRVTATSVNVSNIAKGRVKELRTLIEQQKRTLLGLRSERDEAKVMLNDVDQAQKNLQAMADIIAINANKAQSNQAPAKVLSPAIEPLDHSKPNIPKNIALAVVMGLLTGLAAAVGWEFLDRRVRSEDDMLVADGVPVIGVLSAKPLDARARILPAPVRHRQLGGGFAPQLTLDGGAS
jgi:chain length determinant protein EpsF